MSAAKRQKLMAKTAKTFTNLSAPRQIVNVVNGRKSSTRTTIIGPAITQQHHPKPLPQALGPLMEPVQSSESAAFEEKSQIDCLKETQSQRAKLLKEYSEFFPIAAKLLIMKEFDSRIGNRCSCGEGNREVRCLDCTEFIPLCRTCWVNAHIHQPLHWAHVWDCEKGYFVRHDISTVMPATYGIPLGHNGAPCPKSSKPLMLTLVELNGVHATSVTFCGCTNHPDKWTQLFNANFFPATVAEPQTAFSFQLLRNWQITTLQSKITAYDFIRGLRRLTDNVFTGNVPLVYKDPYKQFMFVTRIWPLLESEKRFGHLHGDGIDKLHPRRPKGNLMVYCPSCPEVGVNMEPGWEVTPANLRHLHSSRRTIDGNMKCGNYGKKNDMNDISLFSGRAYMPEENAYEHYLRTVPQLQKEKVTCNHLTVVNGANRSKFKNQRISGTVNVQCEHIMVLSSVDLHRGERFATVDYAMKLALEMVEMMFNERKPDEIWSYDNICSLVALIVGRWENHHKEHADRIKCARWTCPAAHVRTHCDGCDYLYCYMYKELTAHFYGETAEYAWAIFNALGPSVLQMNPGHRIDTMIIHYGDWNWRKVVSMSRQLLKDLNDAKIQYVEKRDHFAGLCQLNDTKVLKWTAMDRSPRVDPRNKRTVLSVYSHNNDKAPTLKALVDRLMSSKDSIVISSGNVKVGAVASWLTEGLAIFQLQARLRRLAKKCGSTPTKELLSRRTKLSNRIEKWRKLQKQYMFLIAPKIRDESNKDVEDQTLYLPSHFSATERQQYRLLTLAAKEVQMLEGALGDIIRTLQTTVKTLTASYKRKIKHARGQDANTRANTEIRSIEAKRTELIADYNLFRSALVSLGSLDEIKWRPLTEKDTYRKSAERRRKPGDSRLPEGSLWGMTSAGYNPSTSAGLIFGAADSGDMGEESTLDDPTFDIQNLKYLGTQMKIRQARPPRPTLPHPEDPKDTPVPVVGTLESSEEDDEAEDREGTGVKADGWIWTAGRLKNMSASEIEAWEETNDRVQWFRAEADFERKQEMLESKHAEFERALRRFAWDRDTWATLSNNYSDTPGHRAYAREHSDMFESLRLDLEMKYNCAAIPFLFKRGAGETLASRVIQWRQEEEKNFNFDRWKTRPPFKDPTIHAHGGDTREPVAPEADDNDDIPELGSKRVNEGV